MLMLGMHIVNSAKPPTVAYARCHKQAECQSMGFGVQEQIVLKIQVTISNRRGQLKGAEVKMRRGPRATESKVIQYCIRMDSKFPLWGRYLRRFSNSVCAVRLVSGVSDRASPRSPTRQRTTGTNSATHHATPTTAATSPGPCKTKRRAGFQATEPFQQGAHDGGAQRVAGGELGDAVSKSALSCFTAARKRVRAWSRPASFPSSVKATTTANAIPPCIHGLVLTGATAR